MPRLRCQTALGHSAGEHSTPSFAQSQNFRRCGVPEQGLHSTLREEPWSDGPPLAVWRPLAVYLAILAGVVAVSAQRLTALSLSAAPPALWGPFVRPLASAAFEMALLVAVPAAALAARASGSSRRATLLVTAFLLALSVSLAVGLDPGSVAPGRTAQQLLETARDACPSSPERRVQVPLVGLTWT